MQPGDLESKSTAPSYSYRFLLGRVCNGILFYLGWLVCMQQAPGEYPYIGPLLITGIIIYHLGTSHLKLVDFILLLTFAAVGTLVDTLYIQIGLIDYKGGYADFPGIAPLWITSLWALYSICINHSLVWLNASIPLAALMGALGGISSYLTGIKLEAADFHYPPVIWMGIIGFVWSITVPASLSYSRWLNERLSPE